MFIELTADTSRHVLKGNLGGRNANLRFIKAVKKRSQGSGKLEEPGKLRVKGKEHVFRSQLKWIPKVECPHWLWWGFKRFQ